MRKLFLFATLAACGGNATTAQQPVDETQQAVTQSGWSAPIKAPTGCGSALAANSAGEMVLAGYFQTGSGLEAFSIQACTSNGGSNWAGPATIGLGVAPAVAIAPDGRAVIVWQGGPATAPNEQASVRQPNGSWSTPEVIGSVPGHPVIRMDADGNTIAVWSSTTLDLPVASASLPANGSWTAERTLTAKGGAPSVATSPSGQAIIAFRVGNSFNAVTGTVFGDFDPAITVGTTYGHSSHPAPVAIDDAGDAVIGWANGVGNLVATRQGSGAWSAPVQLTAAPNGIFVAMDNAGHAIAIGGQTEDSQAQQIGTATFAARHAVGGNWSTPTLLSQLNAEGPAGVSADPAGTFVITWTDSVGTVQAMTIPPDGGFGAATSISAGPFLDLVVVPGKAVSSTASGTSVEAIN